MRDELEYLEQQLDDLRYHRKNLRSGPSFNMWEQDFTGKVKYRDFAFEEEELLEKEIRLRVQIEELKRDSRGLKHVKPTSVGSGIRLDELFPTMPAAGALLKFDPNNKKEGRWKHVTESGEEPGYRNLPQGVKPPAPGDARTGTLVFPAVMVHPEAVSTLLPCDPTMIGGHTWYVKIMVNSVRRDSEILWCPVSDLVLV